MLLRDQTGIDPKQDVLDRKIQALINKGKEEAERVLLGLQNDLISDEVVPIGPESGSDCPQVLFDPDTSEAAAGQALPGEIISLGSCERFQLIMS